MIKYKKFICLFLITLLLISLPLTSYQNAKASALAVPLVIKTGASILGLSVGGLLGAVIGGVCLVYGTYYVITNWDDITYTVGNALENASGEVSEWWTNIKGNAVHKDDNSQTLDKNIATGEVINFFDYKKNKEPDKKIDVTLPVLKLIKDTLDKNVPKFIPNGLIKYSYSDFISKLPDTTPGKQYYNSSDIAKNFIMNTSNNNYIYEVMEYSTILHYTVPSVNGLKINRFFTSYLNGQIHFNFFATAFDNNKNHKSFYRNQWESTGVYSRPDLQSDTFKIRINLTNDENNYYLANNIFKQETKIRIINEFKEIFRFVNYDIPRDSDDTLDLLGVRSLGGDILNTPTLDLISPKAPIVITPTGGITIYETNDMLKKLSEINLNNTQNTNELSDILTNIKNELATDGQPSFDVNVEIDTDNISRDINKIPDRMKENNKDLISDTLNPQIDNLPSHISPFLDTLENRFSILSYPMSLLIKIVTTIIYSNQKDAILHFPPLIIFGYTLFIGTNFNFTEFLKDEPYKTISNLAQIFTSAYFTFLLFGLFKNKLDEIIKGGGV